MTYLVVDESTKQAALVDPVYDFMQQYVDLLAHEDLTLVYVIATHTHADPSPHASACKRCTIATTSCRPRQQVSMGVSMHVDDEEKIMLGSIPIQFHAAPRPHQRFHDRSRSRLLMTGDFCSTGKAALVETTCPAVESTFTGMRSRCSLGLKAQPSFARHDPPEPK